MKKSLYILGFVLVLMSQIQAKVLDVSYKVSFGVLGQMGISEAHLETNGNRYTIDIKMKATGLAKTLSSNRKERHISKGHVVNGMYISDSYKVIKSYGEKYIEKLYTIDHKKKKVKKEYFSKKNGKVKKRKDEILGFYSNNDLLTLYFNLPKMIKDRSKAGSYEFSAVGAERQKGKVEVRIPKKSQLKAYKKILGEGDHWYITAIIYQKIFASNKGELMLAIGKDGITQKAVLKDLILFGDLFAKRIK
jgi:hypothetical protein